MGDQLPCTHTECDTMGMDDGLGVDFCCHCSPRGSRFLSFKPAKSAMATCLPFDYPEASREEWYLFGTFMAGMDGTLQSQCDPGDRTKGLLGDLLCCVAQGISLNLILLTVSTHISEYKNLSK